MRFCFSECRWLMAGLILFCVLIFPSQLSSPLYRLIIVKKVKADITAYYKPLPGQRKFFTGSYRRDLRMNGTGETFSGDEAMVGHVAADLDMFPLGTILRIPGYGLAVVKDKGSLIRDNRLDVFMGEGDHGLKKSIEWGRKKNITIDVLERGC